MLTRAEQWSIGLKTLARLRPGLRAAHISPRPSDRPSASKSVVRTVLEGISSSFSNTILLGLCADGLPFLLDLANPAPGAILVTGDPQSGKTRLLHAILAGAALTRPSEQTVFTVLAQNPDEFLDLKRFAHCQEVLSARDPAAEGVIWDLAHEIEKRWSGEQALPVIILAIDNLGSFVQSMDESAYRQLLRIIRHGPRYQVWTIATLPSQDYAGLDEHLLASYRTTLLGKNSSPELISRFEERWQAGTPPLDFAEQFCTFSSEGWIHFRICHPEIDDGGSNDEHWNVMV